jgi:hypothetical protein
MTEATTGHPRAFQGIPGRAVAVGSSPVCPAMRMAISPGATLLAVMPYTSSSKAVVSISPRVHASTRRRRRRQFAAGIRGRW